jgi:hypothetical protein
MGPELSQQVAKALFKMRFELEPEARAELVNQSQNAETVEQLPAVLQAAVAAL